jgi:hypothetical protein
VKNRLLPILLVAKFTEYRLPYLRDAQAISLPLSKCPQAQPQKQMRHWASVVTLCNSAPLPVLRVSFAPGASASDESLIVPRTVPVFAWAISKWLNAITEKREILKNRNIRCPFAGMKWFHQGRESNRGVFLRQAQ